MEVRRDCQGNFIFAVCEFGFSYLLRPASNAASSFSRKMSGPEELSRRDIPRDRKRDRGIESVCEMVDGERRTEEGGDDGVHRA